MISVIPRQRNSWTRIIETNVQSSFVRSYRCRSWSNPPSMERSLSFCQRRRTVAVTFFVWNSLRRSSFFSSVRSYRSRLLQLSPVNDSLLIIICLFLEWKTKTASFLFVWLDWLLKWPFSYIEQVQFQTHKLDKILQKEGRRRSNGFYFFACQRQWISTLKKLEGDILIWSQRFFSAPQ